MQILFIYFFHSYIGVSNFININASEIFRAITKIKLPIVKRVYRANKRCAMKKVYIAE
jgi:hypothetical protein